MNILNIDCVIISWKGNLYSHCNIRKTLNLLILLLTLNLFLQITFKILATLIG